MGPDRVDRKQNYVFSHTIGKGTFGVVRCAERKDTDPRQKVAIKVINKQLLRGHEEVVMQEIETLRNLNHPHIVKLIDWFESRDKVRLGMPR